MALAFSVMLTGAKDARIPPTGLINETDHNVVRPALIARNDASLLAWCGQTAWNTNLFGIPSIIMTCCSRFKRKQLFWSSSV